MSLVSLGRLWTPVIHNAAAMVDPTARFSSVSVVGCGKTFKTCLLYTPKPTLNAYLHERNMPSQPQCQNSKLSGGAGASKTDGSIEQTEHHIAP